MDRRVVVHTLDGLYRIHGFSRALKYPARLTWDTDQGAHEVFVLASVEPRYVLYREPTKDFVNDWS